MKTPLLASLCVAALALTACDKKPNEAPASSAATTSFRRRPLVALPVEYGGRRREASTARGRGGGP